MATFVLTPGTDNFSGPGGQFNLYYFTPSTLQSTDTITGGTSAFYSDIGVVTAGGTIAASQFAGVSHLDELRLSGAGNNVTIPDALVASSDHGDLTIFDGAGNDWTLLGAGDADGDGKAELFWRQFGGAAALSTSSVDQLAGSSINFAVGANWLPIDTSWHVIDAPDVNGDGRTDVLFRNDNGTVVVWQLNGAQVNPGTIGAIGNEWTYAGKADINGDSKSDLLWVNNGQLAAWQLNGAQIQTAATIGAIGLDWGLLGATDVDGDHKSDAVWRNGAGSVAVWQLNGTQIQSAAVVGAIGAEWQFSGFGDFNGDGRGDLLWHTAAGDVAIWQMNGTQIGSAAAVGSIGPDWQILDTADFNGDGKTDILWRNSAGQVAIWTMNGLQIQSPALVGGLGTEWHFVQTADFNGDHRADILWRSDDGSVAVWQMNGSQIVSAQVIPANGNDTIDASAVGGTHVVHAWIGSGNDTYTGGAGVDDVYMTSNQLNAGDTISGGPGLGDSFVMINPGAVVSAGQLASVTGFEFFYLLAGGTAHFANTMSSSSLTAVGTAAVDTFDGGGVSAFALRLEGHGGADTLIGGALDDQFVIPDSAFASIEGGGGNDRIVLANNGQSFNLTANAARIHNTEVLWLEDAANTNVTLAGADIPIVSAAANYLYVVGGADDQVNAGGGWTGIALNVTNSSIAPGHTFTEYQHNNGSLLFLDNALSATIAAGPSTPTDANGAANNVTEGAASGTTVGITASAIDAGGGSITYSLTDSAGGRFAINSSTGVVTVANASLVDFESASGHAYSITVQAAAGVLTKTQSFSIAVNDVAPSLPTDANGAGNSVAEGAANGTSVGLTVSSTDVNGGTLTYSLTDNAGGRFAINPSSGVVTVADGTLIDFENTAPGHTYSITAQASDGTLTSSQSFAIAVTDVAPTVPVDSNAAANSVAEGAANGTSVGITASSTDVNGPAVTYSLTDNAGGRFAINSSSGVVTVADGTLIDFENTAPGHTYSITVQTSDGTLTSSQTFVIGVTDVAPTVPADSNATANSVAEGAANGTSVGLTASSTDVNGPAVTYSITNDTSGGGFAIGPSSGIVTVGNAALIDYESAPGHAYSITVGASDGTLTSTQTFVIGVTDVAPTVPFDSNATGNSVAEGAANGTTVGITASSTDANGPAVTYSITNDTSGGGFAIAPSSGIVTVGNAALIDYESAPGHTYSITVGASDGTLTTTQTFSIGVTNVPPSVPTDADTTATSVTEGAANGTTVGLTASSTDPNGPAPTYSLTDNAGGRFAIDSSSGIVTVANSGLIDFEASGGSYNVTVQASDGQGGTSSHTFAIGVINVAPTEPNDTDGSADTILEGSANGTAVGITASSTDVNGPAVTYSLTDDAGGRFAIDPSSGIVTVANAALIDYESASGHAYSITVGASDGTATTTHTFSIDVTNAAPSQPTDSDTPTGGTIAEGASTGTLVGITASSSDVNGGTLTYSLTDDAGGRFFINPGTGEVSVSAAGATTIDYESAPGHAYSITVQASDGTDVSATQTFTIAVTDVAPSAPDDNDTSTDDTVVEGAANGTYTGLTASSTDINGGTVTYTLFDDAGGRFHIDPSSGAVTVLDGTLLDFETATSHDIVVRASDPSGAFTDHTFTIQVTDVAPFAATDSDGATPNSVPEDAANGTYTGLTAASTDVNGGTVTLTLADDAGGRFAIDGAGQVIVADASLLNYETATSHDIVVRATDPSGAYTDQIFTIQVADVAPSGWSDTDSGLNTVAEGAADDTPVGITAHATDPHGDAVIYTFANAADSAGGAFKVDSTSGIVSVADHTLVDFESTAPGHTYNITVTASTAAGTATSTQGFVIGVTDVAPSTPVDNDPPPPASPDTGPIYGTVAEGAGSGSTVGITALSTDVNNASGVVTYTLSNDAGGLFTIDSTSGVVTVTAAGATGIDYETTSPGHTYSITVVASDGTASNTQTFSIGITNAAPSQPVDNDAATNTVSQLAAVGDTVGITAHSDDVNGGAVTYSLTDDTGAAASAGGVFSIDSNGVVTVADTSSFGGHSAGDTFDISVRAFDGTDYSLAKAFSIAFTSNQLQIDLDGPGGNSNFATSYTEQQSAPAKVPVVDSDVSITNPGANPGNPGVGNATSATVVLTDAQLTDSLTVNPTGFPAAITPTITTSAGKITVTLTGLATYDQYESALQHIEFSTVGNPNADAPNTTARHITVTVTDATGTSNTPTTTMSVAAVNDTPDLTPNSPSGVFYTENTAATALLAGEAVSDIDHPQNFASGSYTVAITGNASAGDQIVLLGASGFSATGGSLVFDGHAIGTLAGLGTDTVSITGFTTFATPAVVNALASAFGYQSSSDDPSTALRTVTFTFDDGDNIGSGGAKSDSVTQTVTVTAVNDPPTAVADVAATQAEDTSAPWTITGASLTANDFTGPSGVNESGQTLSVTGVSNFVGGTAVVNGSGNVVFTPTANFNGTASFDYTVQDSGAGNPTSTAHVTFTVTEVNDAPTAGADALSSIPEDSGARVISFASLLGNDSAGPANESGQTLTITAVSNVVGGTATIVGTDIIFLPTANFNGAASFDYTVSDNGTTNGAADFKTDIGSVSFTVTEVNDAPVNAVPGPETTTEDTPVIFDIAHSNAIVVSDIDTGGTNNTVTLSVGNGTLTVDPLVPGGVDAAHISGNTSGSVTLTGSLTAINATLAGSAGHNGPTYTPTTGYTGSDALEVVTNDAGNTGTGGALSDTDTIAITVNPPILLDLDANNSTWPGTGYSALETDPVTAIAVVDADTTITDPTSTTITSATLVIYGNLQPGDVLNFTDTPNITGVHTPGGILTLTGSDTLAAYEAALASVTYTTSSANTGNRFISVFVNDGTHDSNTAGSIVYFRTLDLDANDSAAPGTGFSTTFTEAGGPVAIADTDVSIVDPDDSTPSSGTVQITGNFQSAQDVLAFANDGSTMGDIAAAAFDTGNGTLTLTSAAGATFAEWQAALHAVTYENISTDPNTADRTISVAVGNGTFTTNTNTARTTVHISEVNNAPVATDDALTSIAEDSGSRVIHFTDLTGNDTAVEAGQLLTITSVANPVGGTVQIIGTDVVFTPTGNFNGAASFDYTVQDDGTSAGVADPKTDTGHVTFTVTAVNDAPVAQNGVASGNEDAASITGTAVATDVDSANLTYSLVGSDGGAAHGTVTFTDPATGAYSYVPNGNFFGTDTFTFKATDDALTPLDSNNATITVTVNPVNDVPALDLDTTTVLPTATGYAANYTIGTAGVAIAPTTVGITDVDNTTLASATITITTGKLGTDFLSVSGPLPAGITTTGYNSGTGVLQLTSASGNSLADFQTALHQIVYSNGTGTVASGSRDITVTVNDSTGNSNTATTAITVTADTAPVGVDDTSNITAGTATVSANAITGAGADTDAEDASSALTVSALRTGQEGVSGTAGTVGNALVGTYGALTLNWDGSYTYQLDNNSAAVKALGAGVHAHDYFTYTVRDTALVSNTTGNNNTNSLAQIDINITGVNDNPVANPDSASATEKGGLNNTTAGVDPNVAAPGVLANDSDPDTGDTPTVTAVNGLGGNVGLGIHNAANYGTLTLNADGSFTYAVNQTNSTVEALRTAAQTLSDVFSYTISDGHGGSATTNLTVTIHGADDNPVAVADTYNAVEAGGAVAGTDPSGNVITDAAGKDTDVDAGDTLTVQGVEVAAGHLITDVVSGGLGGLSGSYGTLTLNTNGSFSYAVDNTNSSVQALNNGGSLDDVFYYTIHDAANATSTTSLTIHIAGTNDAPVANNDGTYVVTENRTTSITSPTLLANDTDVDTPNGNPVNTPSSALTSVKDTNTVHGGTVTVNTDGTFSVAYASNSNYLGGDSFTYHTSDGALSSPTSATVTLDVQPLVWYINKDSASATEDGSFANPWKSIANFNTANGGATHPDIVYLEYGNAGGTGIYSEADGINLTNGQTLLGQGVDTTYQTSASAPGGAQTIVLHDFDNTKIPTIQVNNTGNQGVQLAQNNTLQGFHINTNHAGAIGIEDDNLGGGTTSAGTVGALNISKVDISGVGKAIDIDQGGTLTVSLDGITSTGSNSEGVQLGGVSGALIGGTFAVTSGHATSITNAFGNAIHVLNTANNASFNFGDSTTVNDTIPGGHTANGINLLIGMGTGNSFNFGNTSITTDGGYGLSASGAGTLTFGASNSINATGGAALDVTGAALSNATFSTVSSTGGTNGIKLDTIGSGAFTASAGSITGTANAVNINADQGNVSIASTITGAAGGHAVQVTNSGGSGGTTIAFTGAVTDSGLGINLDNNDQNGGATVNFSGGLTVTSTTHTGFNAVNGGTVNVTNGASNHITTTTGTALNISGTTIGSNNVTFQNISAGTVASGPTNGIVLNNTGTSGHLTVTGNGSAGTGGTIQHTTGDGISLTSTQDVNLAWMNINNAANDGILGNTVNGLVLSHLSLSGSGDNEAGLGEGNIYLFELTGNASHPTTFDNLSVTNAYVHNVFIQNSGGTLTNLVLTNNTFSNNGGSTHAGDEFQIALAGGGVAGTPTATVHATHNTFSGNISTPANFTGTGFAAAANDGTLNVHVGDGTAGGLNTFSNNNAGIEATGAVTGNINFDINDNTLTFNRAVGITANNQGTGTATGFIRNNTIGIQGTADSGVKIGDGINIDVEGNGNSNFSITGNTVQSLGGDGLGFNGIFAQQGNGPGNTTGTLNLTITGNTVRDILDDRGLFVATVNTNGASSIVAQISGNTFTNANAQGANTTARVGGAPGGTDPVYVTQASASALASANGLTASGAPGNTMRVDANVQFNHAAPSAPPATPQLAANGQGPGADGVLTMDQLAPVVAAAVAHWQAAGASAEQLALLYNAHIHVADLPDSGYLGNTMFNDIAIDTNGAGWGWFVDPTPWQDSEFNVQKSETAAVATSGDAAGHIDLLTVVEHELGHILGLADSTQDGVMNVALGLGTRVLPSQADVTAANALVIAGTSGNDVLDAGAGGHTLVGGAGADTFVFTAAPQADVPVTHIADYSALEGDTIDISALSLQAGPKTPDAAMVRAVEGHSGDFATLEVNTEAAQGGTHWVQIAQLDNVHAGDAVDVIVDPTHAVHHIHADWIA